MKLDYQRKVCHDVIEICKPLFNVFKFNFFSHVRAFHDGHFASLMTYPTLTEYFLAQKYPIRFSRGEGLCLDAGFYIGAHLPDVSSNKFINDLQKKFNTAHFIHIIDKQKTYDDMYSLATTPENEHIINHLINNIDLLHRFNFYYKDKSKSLINKSNLTKYNADYFAESQQIIHANIDRESCLKNLFVKKMILTGNLGNVEISKREFECLKLMIRSYSFKEIGKMLNISFRTVETYINNLKAKLGCHTRSQLIDLAFSLNIHLL